MFFIDILTENFVNYTTDVLTELNDNRGKVYKCLSRPRGKKRNFRTSHTSSYSLVLPSYSSRTPFVLPPYFLVLPRTSSYFLRTPFVLPRTSLYSLVLPPTPFVLPSYFGSTEVSLFPPWYGKMGDYSKALSFAERALEIAQRSLPSNHPDLQWHIDLTLN